jgi:hypothetical protein
MSELLFFENESQTIYNFCLQFLLNPPKNEDYFELLFLILQFFENESLKNSKYI